jgi:hypothetical protein
MIQEPIEIKTTLVNYRAYRTYIFLVYFSTFMFFVGMIVSDAKQHRVQPSTIEGHLIFKHFKKSKFIVNNFETLMNIGTATFVSSLLGMLLFSSFAFRCFNSGFFNINIVRVNVNGEIFYWQEISSLKVTINSPKAYGTRSAMQGFKNWIEFIKAGETHKYEFYLETWTMEDQLLKLLKEMNGMGIRAQVKVIDTKKIWFMKILEELGIDPQ